MKPVLLILFIALLPCFATAQLMVPKETFTKADTLRGSIGEYRKGWDVLRYDLLVQPDISKKTLAGKTVITYKETLPVSIMQIDLQQPLVVDSIVGDSMMRYSFQQDSNVCFVHVRDENSEEAFAEGVRKLTVWYHGKPVEAIKPPWDGGLVWSTDKNGNPFVATACQGLGASVWYPCKDHQSDEPDSGVTVTIIAPDTLTAVSNGRLISTAPYSKSLKAWTWEVKNPINNYDVTMNIGKYTSWNDTLMGEGGKLDLQYWVLDYNLEKANQQFEQVKPMLRSHEYWFGKYPFYEDSYKLIETPFLGMEHQSGVAYGNRYMNGYHGKDLSGTGWGMLWDFIIVHESGHEWFGNNITSKDIADMWVHEGFTNYSEVLYLQYNYGKDAGDAYCNGIRKNIKNDSPIIGYYGVNKEGSSDMYPKAANMLHMIRNTINDDAKFRNILRGLNQTFWHQTVTTKDVEDYISAQSGIDFTKVFDQYLRTTDVPVLEYYVEKQKLFYRWTNCIAGFDLPIHIQTAGVNAVLFPTTEWLNDALPDNITAANFSSLVEDQYYVKVKNTRRVKSQKSKIKKRRA